MHPFFHRNPDPCFHGIMGEKGRFRLWHGRVGVNQGIFIGNQFTTTIKSFSMNTHQKFYLVGIICLLGVQVAAQPVPYMWVSEQQSGNLEHRFSVGTYNNDAAPGKKSILSQIIGSAHPGHYTYPLSSFKDLITKVQTDDNAIGGTGVRLYFVAYHSGGPNPGFNMGRVKDKQVVLVFAPSKSCNAGDVGNYYMFGPVDHQVHPVPPNAMQDWQNYYVANDDNSSGLTSTLEPGVSENMMPVSGDYSDTRSIFYCMSDFIDFIQNETTYQGTQGITIDHIEMDFAAYTDNGASATGGKFKDRLFVLYEFVSDGEVVYIDDTPGFASRKHKTAPACICQAEFFGGDNGQLCPPSCP